MSIFTRKIKPLFQVNFPKPYCIVVLWDLQFFFTYFGDPQLLLHNWLWWRPSAHTQYSQSSEFTHYKSHFGPKIDVSITVIYTKAAREEEEEACVSGAMQFIIGYSSRANSLSPMKRIPAVINYVKSCVRRTGHKLIWQIFIIQNMAENFFCTMRFFLKGKRIHSLFCYYWFGFFTNHCQNFFKSMSL